ncbi:protein kinase [Pyxidicoccus fallax]|uniref:Protein kinase n=1 Tax=Pyxidicoccus fallax TaxID=394095 RepID=A0A848LPJ2_9BACT|nr:serine/threonine-protein kinase [Pyxidicoccus fallax]NMO19589.1 protein kinase [Pyxidicoccus fallax]NPC85943.1 protein kinase [Pyxidicoccus fallax]
MSTAPTESPRFLGRYELVHPLGQGGMGEVFLAKISGAAGFEKPCIVKTILPALLKDRQFLDRFHHEAKVLVHLVHSSIAQVYDMGEADGTYYMALEYVAGVDLAYLLEQARTQGVAVPVPVALSIGQRIAEGLGYAHRKAGPDGSPLGIVHRDVSPHNVMVSYEGEVKVIDFGLAKSAARSKYTLPSTVMGKLGYMSPEQVRAELVDHRSDIYSSAVVVWEMLAGRSLIPHGTVGEMMAAMSQPVVPSLCELRPDADAALDAVVRRALEAKPDGRYARTDEWARALNGELVRTGASVGAEEVGQFVRTLCPEAFAEQRKLISKVSSSTGLRRTPLPGTGTGLYGSGAPADDGVSGHEPTVVRNVGDIQPSPRRSGGVARPDAVYADGDDVDTGATTLRQGPGTGTARFDEPRKPSRPEPAVVVEAGVDAVTEPRRPSRPVPATAAEDDALEARASRRRPMGLYAAIAVLLVIATAAITALLVRPPAAPPAPVASVATAPAATPSGSGVKPDAERTGATAPVAQASGTPAATPPSPDGPTAPGGEAAAPTGGTVAAAAGTAAPAVAPTGGTGAPAPEAVPSSASAIAAPGKTEEVAANADDGKRPASTPKAPGKKKAPSTPAARYVAASVEVLPLVDEGGRFYVARGWAARLLPDMEADVVGPPGKDGRRQVLGLARVIRPARLGGNAVKSRRTYVELDEKALASTSRLYLVPPRDLAPAPTRPDPEPAEPVVVAPSVPVKPEKKTLYADVSRSKSMLGLVGDDEVKVRNMGTTSWSNCYVVKDQRSTAWLGKVPAGDVKSASRFKLNTQFDVPSGKVGVFCDEGEYITSEK